MVFHFVNADESSLSEGKAPLVEVFSLLSTFELQKIKTSSLSQSMLQANE